MTTYREDNWKFDPEVDLDYENKFFEIIFDSSKTPEEIDSLWREPLKEFIKDGKGIVLGAFPNPLTLGFIIDDLSKDYLLSVVNELKRLNMPDDVSVIRYKNYKDSQTFNSFLDFQLYIKNITE